MDYPSQLVPVAEGVHVWAPDGSGTWGLANCVLVTSDRSAALVDTPYSETLTRRLLTAAEQVLPDGASITTVINTHANGDHCYGNEFLPQAEVIATQSALDHACLEPTPAQMQQLVHGGDPDSPLGWYMKKHFGRFDYSGLQLRCPDRTFTGAEDLKVGALDVRLIEVGPAHTAGDLIVHLPQRKTVCAGDIVFHGDHPVHWAGPLASVWDACSRILELDPDVIVPGHGPIMGPDQLRDYMAYLTYVREQAHTLHRHGLPADEAALALIGEGRHPHLDLPERLFLLVAAEYRHLESDPQPPNLVQLVAQAARLALDLETAQIHPSAPRPISGSAATVPTDSGV
ncbi:MBL fold metallo-hydrolase [Streptomyces sp. 7N604]|uniref:MBL fold metallo-hydrolase n=1 Tax=Streptomyces sp. 7N604 TaxID=3457415 RepID=UPI003FD685B0